MFIEVLFTLSNNWKPSEHYIHNQILQINKKKRNELWMHATRTNLKNTVLSKKSQTKQMHNI